MLFLPRLVIFTSCLKQHKGYFGMDLVILNLGQMTRTTPELDAPSPSFLTTPAGGPLAPDGFGVHQAHLHGGSSIESGFEPGNVET
ncbi:hypothetical protein AVEN_148555-1 [Araneus ventricosus]|uniref:Uncharacterized protein n=1 Tax=Araneus ventricosus TaxID=182803 RepID=A0A4Y2V733_ARAVE|nr:hypothetical protein AVEN_148555-1 [Araneus ventricosus]